MDCTNSHLKHDLRCVFRQERPNHQIRLHLPTLCYQRRLLSKLPARITILFVTTANVSIYHRRVNRSAALLFNIDSFDDSRAISTGMRRCPRLPRLIRRRRKLYYRVQFRFETTVHKPVLRIATRTGVYLSVWLWVRSRNRRLQWLELLIVDNITLDGTVITCVLWLFRHQRMSIGSW